MGLFQIAALLVSLLKPQPIRVPEELSEQLKSFEPSAALYVDDLKSFLIANDDTTEEDTPLLFLMDSNGQVSSSPLEIKGIKKMTDIESISQDEKGTLYLLSSQGLNKNGNEKKERNLFVRAEREGQKIQTKNSIYLRPLLLEALENSGDSTLKKMQKNFKNDLDVESHFIRNGELYLGLKEPQPVPGTAVIVKAGNVDALFSKESLKVCTWKTLDFKSVSGEEDLLSDILPTKEGFLFSTTSEKGPGRLWRYEETNGKLSLLEEFADFNPEGLAFNTPAQKLLVVFDQGEEEGLFTLGN